MVAAQAQQQLYTHAAEPKAVQQRKAKVRSCLLGRSTFGLASFL